MEKVFIHPETFSLPWDQFTRVHAGISGKVDLMKEWLRHHAVSVDNDSLQTVGVGQVIELKEAPAIFEPLPEVDSNLKESKPISDEPRQTVTKPKGAGRGGRKPAGNGKAGTGHQPGAA